MSEPTQHPPITREWFAEALAEMRAKGKPGEKVQAFNAALIAEFRATGGRSMGEFPTEIIALITMKGAKSGLDRTVPLGIFEIDRRLILVATQGGLPTHPQWYYNLVANPIVTVERQGQNFRARAVLTEGADRDHIFSRLPEIPFKEYTARAGSRVIPLFELQRIDEA
jgi:deazaflavin-dependent oxidoreductase (nitroreductase family)